MPAFTDYDFYKAHGGKLTEVEYSAVVDDAHAEIISQTNGQAKSAPEEMKESVRLCECALVDVIASYQKGVALLPKGIGSASNDGMYVSAGNGELTTAQTEALDRKAICARYLQYPVNLMCRWL